MQWQTRSSVSLRKLPDEIFQRSRCDRNRTHLPTLTERLQRHIVDLQRQASRVPDGNVDRVFRSEFSSHAWLQDLTGDHRISVRLDFDPSRLCHRDIERERLRVRYSRWWCR